MDTIDKASEYAHKAADKITDATAQAAEALGEKGEQLKNAEQKMMKHCCSYARDYPVTSLAIAVAAGFVLSRLLRDR